jgi:hypothetical protein
LTALKKWGEGSCVKAANRFNGNIKVIQSLEQCLRIIVVFLKTSQITLMENSYPLPEPEDVFDWDMNGLTIDGGLTLSCDESLFSDIYTSTPVQCETSPVSEQFTHMNPHMNEVKKRKTVMRGAGPEAAKTAGYLARDNSASSIFCRLHHRFGFVSKAVLMSVINGVMASCPDDCRPAPPNRSMKRAKGGLVAWLDIHQVLALKFLEDKPDVVNSE